MAKQLSRLLCPQHRNVSKYCRLTIVFYTSKKGIRTDPRLSSLTFIASHVCCPRCLGFHVHSTEDRFSGPLSGGSENTRFIPTPELTPHYHKLAASSVDRKRETSQGAFKPSSFFDADKELENEVNAECLHNFRL
jgi:hypothetical protein